jgi:hypothetical protein
MKKLVIASLIILLSILIYIAQGENYLQLSSKINSVEKYSDGILKSELKSLQNVADYNFDIEFFAEQKMIFVKEKIIWRNKTEFPTNEIYFHLYPNAYKNTNTHFAKGYNISDEAAQTEIDIKKIFINGTEKSYHFVHPEIFNPHDSTVIKTTLEKEIIPDDSIEVYFEYELKIPQSVKRFGYARGRNFFFISQWFPKVGVFENGKWICSPYYPYLNFYSDFGKYNARIKVPHQFKIASTGVQTNKYNENEKSIYYFTQSGVHDFVWLATDEILQHNSVYTRKDGTEILIQTYVQPEREKYIYRYIQAVKNCLEYFEENIGIYPYQNISLVDVPRTSNAGGMEYPTLFTVSADLFSPQSTGWPEYLVAHEFAHQYFQGIIANNEVYEAWLDEGFASYLSTKIMFKYYPEIFNFFKFATYIPIYGLDFFSYKDIPIIYTLAEIQVPEGTQSIRSYYKNMTVGSIADTSSKLPTRISYVTNSYSKPELMLHALERFIGIEKMSLILKSYYNEQKFKHPRSHDFISVVKKNVNENLDWFFTGLLFSSHQFDYRITSVSRISGNEYEVLAERLQDGVFKNDIYLYTEKDTLKQIWDGKERWKQFRFKTEHEVIAAEIDPHRKNLLDINFANNSYTLENRVWGSWSLAIRVFFWVQNALMILGSVG